MRGSVHVWLGVVAAAAAGCLPATSHQCETSDQCGAAGTCEASGACSFPATDCPSGRRFGDGTGPLAGQCVTESPGLDAAAIDPDAAPTTDGAGADAAPVVPWGDGHHGNLTVNLAQAQINSYGFVREDAAVGALMITATRNSGATVGTWNDNFEPGDRIMLWRTTGLADPATSGSVVALSLTGDIGRWFVTRVVARVADRITLADPLPFGCPADLTQVIKLPELDVATVLDGNTVFTPDWGGQWGGLVGFYANQLVLDGATIDAGSDGFGGGNAENASDFYDCAALDGRSQSGGGARKGESFVPARYGSSDVASGRGNIFHGGGGGAGVGGGGRGGNDADGRAVGGMPGVGLRYAPSTHLAMGGGGGAGEDNATTAGIGGWSGGVVWLMARTITCLNGATIDAGGGSGGSHPDDGPGGGGGGGLIWIRAETISGCDLRARGGAGGSTLGAHGPGGGGGGGRVVIVADTATGITTSVTGGASGDNGTSANGAAAGQVGSVCGNGTLEPGETCDDGNFRGGDACTYCVE